MASVKEIDPGALINEVSREFEKIEDMKPPAWAAYVKTGVHKERPPSQDNWWYIRSAAIFRKVYLNPDIGVSKLRKEYGGRKNRGHKPEHTFKASGAIIRKILQQLEAAQLIKTEKGKGRRATPKGQSFMDNIVKKVK